ncbi:MAG: ATP-grasp domain-containing protein [Thermoanaerobaculia bacterium]
MPNIVFVAPYYVEATLRFAQAVAETEDVRLGLVSQEPLERLPDRLRSQVAQHWQVDNALDVVHLTGAVEAIASRLGPIDRLLGVLEQLQVPLAETRRRLDIKGMEVETARNFRDKARMKTLLREAGIPCARHRLAETPQEVLRFAEEVGYPLVLKPPAGAGARSTYRVDGPEALQQAVELTGPRTEEPVLVEEFVSGREHSFETISIDGQPVWHSLSRYLPSPLEVLRKPWIQWCILLPRQIGEPRYDEVRQIAFKTLQTLGMATGLTHLEWFQRVDGSVAVSEVAARPPGAQLMSLTSYAHDFNFTRAWACLMVHHEFEPPARRYVAGGAFLRGQGSGRRVVAVHGLEQAQRELGSLVLEAKLPRPGQPASDSYEGEGYVLMRHSDTDVVERGLMRLVSLVRVELG